MLMPMCLRYSLSLEKGDFDTALREPFSVVLTNQMARKYFGDESSSGLPSANPPRVLIHNGNRIEGPNCDVKPRAVHQRLWVYLG